MQCDITITSYISRGDPMVVHAGSCKGRLMPVLSPPCPESLSAGSGKVTITLRSTAGAVIGTCTNVGVYTEHTDTQTHHVPPGPVLLVLWCPCWTR